MAFYSRGRRPLAEEEKSTDAAKARTRAMELLAGQELSSGQLYERLNRRYTQQTSAAVVAEMVQREYINDARYAETRAHALLAAKKSRRAAAQNLRQKGLAAGEIQQRWMLFTPPMFPARTRSWKPPPLWWKGITAKSWKRAAGIWSLRPCSGGDFRIPSLRKPFGESKRNK